MVHRARRGRTRASSRRVGIGRVARARTLDARALTTCELSLRRAKPRLERGTFPRARPARAKPLGRRRHVARRQDARRDLPDHERYRSVRRFACPTSVRACSQSRASECCKLDLLTGALMRHARGLVSPATERMRFGSESRRANPEQTVKISKFRRCARILSTSTNQPESCFSVRALHKGSQQRDEGSSPGARADSSHAASSTHVRRAVECPAGQPSSSGFGEGRRASARRTPALLSQKRNCRVARFPRVPEISRSRKSSPSGSRREPRGAGRSTRTRG